MSLPRLVSAPRRRPYLSSSVVAAASGSGATGAWLDLASFITGTSGKKGPYDELADAIGEIFFAFFFLSGFFLLSFLSPLFSNLLFPRFEFRNNNNNTNRQGRLRRRPRVARLPQRPEGQRRAPLRHPRRRARPAGEPRRKSGALPGGRRRVPGEGPPEAGRRQSHRLAARLDSELRPGGSAQGSGGLGAERGAVKERERAERRRKQERKRAERRRKQERKRERKKNESKRKKQKDVKRPHLALHLSLSPHVFKASILALFTQTRSGKGERKKGLARAPFRRRRRCRVSLPSL